MRVAIAQLIPIRLPLVRPVHTANGVVAFREGTVVRLESEDGLVGRGEASPYSGFGVETTLGARAGLEVALSKLVGCSLEELGDAIAGQAPAPCARAGLETARLELEARRRGLPLCETLVPGASGSVRELPCNALLAEASTDELASAARRACDAGFETLKLKVGALALEQDVERIAAIRSALGRRPKLRLDANQAYDIGRARSAIDAFAPFEIEYLEQPLPASDLEGLAALRREASIPIALDEGALDLAQLRSAIEHRAADVVVIKPSAAGGPFAALAMARLAREHGLDIAVTTLLDSAIGVAAAVHAAAAIAAEGPVRACGLATHGHFELDVATIGAPVNGSMEVPRSPGLGIDEDPALLSRCLADAAVEFRA
ncbi:MAG: o-succinylbenzoate synthase [Myxococcota bacterium]|nr:o-succinylbenzoate synthase [Myxococcota bacterium]